MRELLDVVDKREVLPPSVDFGLPSQREAVELLVVAQVGKHRLDGGHAPPVLRSPFDTVDVLCAVIEPLVARAHAVVGNERVALHLGERCEVGFAVITGIGRDERVRRGHFGEGVHR